jgi:hypothetical protein
MTTTEYLKGLLESQTVKEDSPELEALRKHREAVEKLLREKFPKAKLTIRYGGSKAKGTMILQSYDLDIICYFDNGDDSAGETLEDIFNNVEKALAGDYTVERKTSALRLKSKEKIDFHIDVVPGRFTDDTKTDAFLYISTGEKKRLKTNLQVHIDHVKDSGVVDALKLIKLWRVRNSLSVRNFVLELIAIELLSSKKSDPLDEQLEYFFKELFAQAETIAVKDPANPEGNDLSELLTDDVRAELKSLANRALGYIETSNWEAIFGPLPKGDGESRKHRLQHAAAAAPLGSKPWGE